MLIVCAPVWITPEVHGQMRTQPVAELDGQVGLGLMLRKLNMVGSFMMMTAHPDDENNAILAMLSHGQGIRTALVSATRGDGGQNEIGTELFDALAVLARCGSTCHGIGCADIRFTEYGNTYGLFVFLSPNWLFCWSLGRRTSFWGFWEL